MGVPVLAKRSCELHRGSVEGLWAGGVYIEKRKEMENFGYEKLKKKRRVQWGMCIGCVVIMGVWGV